MKVLITYSSKTGNTKKIANEVAKEVTKLYPQADFKNIDEVVEFDYDIIFLGGWIDRGNFNKEVECRLDSIKNKNVAFFFTLGAYSTSMHAYDCITNIRTALDKSNNRVINHFHCMGPVSKDLKERMAKLPKDHPHYPDEARLKRWACSESHPNEEDFEAARSFVSGTFKALNNKRV
ncbi:flavodoxin family protein [Alkaliphilus pronyensis]|nr:flavodoxin family protein [Alkaliphilus pronyensis]